VEQEGHRGKAPSIDPGIWIPTRFKNWFVSECEYRWRDGDVRVQLEAVSAWGTQKINVPTFDNYLSTMRAAGTIQVTKNYYDYIRSIGDLHWKTEDGKDSTEAYCPEAQALSASLGQGGDSTAPSSAQAAYPQANCKTGSANKDAVINALYSVGVNTKNGFAGVLGNFQAESGIQANRHNLANPGTGCSNTPTGPLGSTGYGIAQWCGSRQTDIFNKCGRNSNLSCEMEFMVQEIRVGKDVDPAVVRLLNAASSPSEAADVWNDKYERGPGGIQKRRDEAERIVNQIKCDKPS
jgi:hypothetical protein